MHKKYDKQTKYMQEQERCYYYFQINKVDLPKQHVKDIKSLKLDGF